MQTVPQSATCTVRGRGRLRYGLWWAQTEMDARWHKLPRAHMHEALGARGVWCRLRVNVKRKMAPAVYIRNRVAAHAMWALESLVRRANPHYEQAPDLRTPSTEWLPATTSGKAVEHPAVPGLFLLRQAVSPSDVHALRAFVDSTTLPPRCLGVHDAAERAEREAAVLLDAASKAPPQTELAIEAAEQASSAIARRDALHAAAASLPPPPPPLRTKSKWEWFPFEPGRLMAPMLAHPAHGGASFESQQEHLEGFEVFGNAKVADWLSLGHLEAQQRRQQQQGQQQPPHGQQQLPQHNAEKDERILASAHGVDWLGPEASEGLSRLIALQRELPSMLPCISSMPRPRALFVQLQHLERGRAIAAHLDAPTPPADVVATLSLGTGGRDTVRVGPAHFRVVAGDVYAISGKARWEMSHEVHASMSDRLSLTFRYTDEKALLQRT